MTKTLLPSLCLVAFSLLPICPVSAQAPPAPAASPAASNLDFGDFSSAAITAKAWGALDAKNYNDALAYTGKCIDMFKDKAVEMQKALTAPTTDKDQTFAQWALNDVGTCYYIQAKAYEGLGKKKEAMDSYKFLADNLAYAQCWDPKGWFWKPADAAKEQLKQSDFDSLK
jgi:hypothetical protein